jgi:hypothetical protein
MARSDSVQSGSRKSARVSSPPSPTELLSLPEEMLEHQFSYLDLPSALGLASSCSRLHAILSRPRVWQGLLRRATSLNVDTVRRAVDFLQPLELDATFAECNTREEGRALEALLGKCPTWYLDNVSLFEEAGEEAWAGLARAGGSCGSVETERAVVARGKREHLREVWRNTEKYWTVDGIQIGRDQGEEEGWQQIVALLPLENDEDGRIECIVGTIVGTIVGSGILLLAMAAYSYRLYGAHEVHMQLHEVHRQLKCWVVTIGILIIILIGILILLAIAAYYYQLQLHEVRRQLNECIKANRDRIEWTAKGVQGLFQSLAKVTGKSVVSSK